MRCAEARKGKEMKAEERRWCAAAVCMLRHCFASSVFFGALAHHKWWRGRYRLLLLDLVRALLVVRLNRLATRPNKSPPQASASILLCSVEELLRADASREYFTSTKGPLHSVLAAVADIYHAQPYGTVHCGGRSRGSVCKARQSRT
jgi:hypothetical protein